MEVRDLGIHIYVYTVIICGILLNFMAFHFININCYVRSILFFPGN